MERKREGGERNGDRERGVMERGDRRERWLEKERREKYKNIRVR